MQETNILKEYDALLASSAVPTRARVDIDKLTHFIFNPFGEKVLTTLYVRFYGMPSIPAGFLIPIREFAIMDINCAVVGLQSQNSIDTPLQSHAPVLKEFAREPGKIVRDILRNYGEVDILPTGVCEIEALRGCEDIGLARDVQLFCLPERFKTVDAALEHLQRAVAEAHGMPGVFGQVAERLMLSYSQNKASCRRDYQRLIADLERYKETATGKSEPTEHDKAVCAWLDLPEPRMSGYMAAMQPQQPQQIVIQQAPAPQEEQEERSPCPHCFEGVRVINGKMAPICRFCGRETAPQVEAKPQPVRDDKPQQQQKR